MTDLDRLREREGGALPGCPSDLRLERFVQGELEGAALAEVESHIASCEACPTRVASLRQGFAAFPEVDPAALRAHIESRVGARVEAQTKGRKLARVLMMWGAPLAAAAIVLLVLKKPRDAAPLDSASPTAPRETVLEATREKGGLALHVFRQVSGRSDEVVSGSRLSPGERIRFVIDLPSAGEVRVVGVEASGNLYDAWPSDPSSATEHPAGAGQELPGAVALDASHGREVLYLVHCPGATRPPSCGKNQERSDPPRCTADRAECQLSPFVMEKP